MSVTLGGQTHGSNGTAWRIRSFWWADGHCLVAIGGARFHAPVDHQISTLCEQHAGSLERHLPSPRMPTTMLRPELTSPHSQRNKQATITPEEAMDRANEPWNLVTSESLVSVETKVPRNVLRCQVLEDAEIQEKELPLQLPAIISLSICLLPELPSVRRLLDRVRVPVLGGV